MFKKLTGDELIHSYLVESENIKPAVEKKLQVNEIEGNPWYIEYFAIGPCVIDRKTDEVKTSEDFSDMEDFEYAINNDKQFKVCPIVFGPNFTRETQIYKYDTLADALDAALNMLGEDQYITSTKEMLENNLIGNIDLNSITLLCEYNTDVQDLYGTYIRITQKPFKSNNKLAAYYLAKNLLGTMLDNGIIGDPYSKLPNFDNKSYCYQGQ